MDFNYPWVLEARILFFSMMSYLFGLSLLYAQRVCPRNVASVVPSISVPPRRSAVLAVTWFCGLRQCQMATSSIGSSAFRMPSLRDSYFFTAVIRELSRAWASNWPLGTGHAEDGTPS